MYREVDPTDCRPTDRPLHLTNEYIHASVRSRFRLDGPGISDKGLYDCRALTDSYKLVVDYGADTPRAGEPDVHWKLKFKDNGAGYAKILPEAPLWGIEKELCRRDPETYDYVRKPPATGGARKGRKGGRSESVALVEGAGGRRSFVEGEGRGKRGSFVPPVEKRSRSRAGERERERERPRSFDERSSVVRAGMPHRREKDKAWWEGVDLSGGGGGPDGRDMGRDRRDGGRERDKYRDRDRRRSGGVV